MKQIKVTLLLAGALLINNNQLCAANFDRGAEYLADRSMYMDMDIDTLSPSQNTNKTRTKTPSKKGFKLNKKFKYPSDELASTATRKIKREMK